MAPGDEARARLMCISTVTCARIVHHSAAARSTTNNEANAVDKARYPSCSIVHIRARSVRAPFVNMHSIVPPPPHPHSDARYHTIRRLPSAARAEGAGEVFRRRRRLLLAACAPPPSPPALTFGHPANGLATMTQPWSPQSMPVAFSRWVPSFPTYTRARRHLRPSGVVGPLSSLVADAVLWVGLEVVIHADHPSVGRAI